LHALGTIKALVALKYENESFDHGIVPISYNWNTTTGQIIDLDIPSIGKRNKEELAQ